MRTKNKKLIISLSLYAFIIEKEAVAVCQGEQSFIFKENEIDSKLSDKVSHFSTGGTNYYKPITRRLSFRNRWY